MNSPWKPIELITIVFIAAVLGAGCRPRTVEITPVPTATETPGERAETPTAEGEAGASLPEATVAISPGEGPPGTEVQVVVSGFPAETEVELGVGRKGSEPDRVMSRRTDRGGSFSTALAIPPTAIPGEGWVVSAMGEEGLVAVSDIFEVSRPAYRPAVSVSPESGPPGTELAVVAEGFPPDARVEIGVGREDSEYDVVGSLQVRGDGSLTTETVVPNYAEAGERWVVVLVTEDRSVKGVSNVFQVEGAGYQPTVDIGPESGPPGTRVRVVAQGFPSNTDVEIGIGRVDSEYDVVASARTDASGRVDTEIVIPGYATPEDPWVIVVASESPPLRAISSEFDITRAATPTPGGELFTRTNIYFIAIGDEGKMGEEVGCGDSVVPVEVAIEPTIAPLTAAIDKLLSVGTREYGQIGLYNALYRSDLELDTVRIENREATIGLTGELALGGVCDEPRVRAQLRQTALQYSTVNEVSIFINGRALDEVLAARTPTPESGQLSRTNIYLIAVGDDGQLGKEIGCDDSVVPVEVAIEPTIAPLTAALNKLLALGTREYGQSGLYNALYRSDLAVEDVDIEAREAIIKLSGTLSLGGTCDEPRVRAQLQETALQYGTVDRVSIFINGTPLEELLGQR